MANSLGDALSGLKKPGVAVRKGTPKTSMTVSPMPPKPKTFADKNLELGFGAGGANNVTTKNAKKGGTIKPQLNATPKMGVGNVIKGLSKT